MQCQFQVGQKVVCVNADHWLIIADDEYIDEMDGLRVGEVYTVRRVGTMPWHGFPDDVCVWLEEIRRPVGDGDLAEVGYHHTRFRPATDISTLEALLQSKPVKEPA